HHDFIAIHTLYSLPTRRASDLQKNGYISKPEEWTLEDVVKKSRLPNAVINILIHYILVIQGNVVFEKGLAYKISNDWAQNKVTRSEEHTSELQSRENRVCRLLL